MRYLTFAIEYEEGSLIDTFIVQAINERVARAFFKTYHPNGKVKNIEWRSVNKISY